jgi:prepilin-type N-terminal cleavage/methylation domain-containing protein
MMKTAIKSSRWAGKAGFSVIELMVVVVIMTAVLAASIPALKQHRDTIDLKRAAEDIAGTLKLARQRSVSTNNDVIVVFDSSVGTFYAFEDADGSGTYDVGETRTGTYGMSKKVNMNSISFAGEQVTFSPRGSASETGNVVLVNTRSKALRVDLTAATGLVYVSTIYAYEG